MATRNVAVLIDFENISSTNHVETVLEFSANRGRIAVKKAFGDWTGPIENSQDELRRLDLELVHQESIGKGRNSCDMRMVIEAMDLLHNPNITLDTFVLVTCDADFVPLADRLKSAGKLVIGAGRPEVTSDLLKATVHEFIPVGKGESASATQPRSIPRSQMLVKSVGESERRRADDLGPIPMSPVDELDIKTQGLILKAMADVCRRNNGLVKGAPLYARMRAIEPSFDYRNLGFHSFADMLARDRFLEIRGRGSPGDITVWTKIS